MSKRKVPLAAVARRDLEAERLARLPGSATLTLGELAGSIKDGLMAFCCTAGLLVVDQLMEEELTDRIGPRGRHDPDRVAEPAAVRCISTPTRCSPRRTS
jgi:hypothetical protein